ncbi:MAG: 4Fe-4S dicluster domain-containing protein [Desulfitobacteriaceae bacterium]
MAKEKKQVKITINNIRCKKCGICHEFCLVKVFTLTKDGTPEPTHQEDCTYCRLCDLRCPDFAINLEVLV